MDSCREHIRDPALQSRSQLSFFVGHVLVQCTHATCPRNIQNGALEGPQQSPGGSKMESRRVQNGARRVQNEAQWAKMGARKGPNATTRAFVRLKCRFELAKPTPRCGPGSPGPARARFCLRFWAPKGAQGVQNQSKKRTKSVSTNIFVSDRVLEPKFIDFGIRKTSF